MQAHMLSTLFVTLLCSEYNSIVFFKAQRHFLAMYDKPVKFFFFFYKQA